MKVCYPLQFTLKYYYTKMSQTYSTVQYTNMDIQNIDI